MNFVELAKIASEEALAVQFLQERGILRSWSQCPFRGSERIGKVRRYKMLWYGRGKEWSIRKESLVFCHA